MEIIVAGDFSLQGRLLQCADIEAVESLMGGGE